MKNLRMKKLQENKLFMGLVGLEQACLGQELLTQVFKASLLISSDLHF
mgnify:CR=1 FL=1